jgi:hypothetical protein
MAAGRGNSVRRFFMEERMSVRAKFRVTNADPRDEENGGTVYLEPVVDGSDENREFFKYTPAGKIELYTVNVAALDQFAVGDQFYVDFTKAE